jgi:hypothetical protein
MPPPASYIIIDALPFSRLVTVAEFNVANEIWFKLITGLPIAYGQWTSKPAGVSLFSNVYESDGTTLVQRTGSSTGFWQPLDAGTYYIKIDRFPVAAIAADLTYEAAFNLLDDINYESGAVLIADDTGAQLPAAIFEADGTIPTFVSAVPTSEIGDSLSNGYLLIHDRFGKYGTANSLVLFTPTLTFDQVIIPSTPFTGFPRITHSTTDFYVVDSALGNVWKVTTAGAISLVAVIAEILAGGVECLGINSAGTIIYFGINNNTGNILKYVIATNVTTVHHTIAGFTAPADKISLTFDANPGDLLVLPDGTYVTWWTDDSLVTSNLIHISAAGVLLNQFAFADPDSINHLAYASTTASTHVKLWAAINLMNQSKIGDFNLTTGVFDTSFTTDTFGVGQNINSNDNTKFGPSSSCPFYTLFTGVTTPVGLFKIVDNKRDDTINDTGDLATDEVAIPDPTFKTGLMP